MTETAEALDLQTLENITAARTYRGLPATQYMVPYRNVAHLLELRTQENPDKVFLIYYDNHGNRSEYTYARFSALVNQTANLLANELGVRNGDRVATISFNHADTVILYFACWKIGATVAPQNITEDDARIAFILRNSESVVCFVRQEYLERAERVIHGTEQGLGAANIRQIIQIDGDAKTGYLHLPTAIADQPLSFTPVQPATLESECLLVYTSGTTGAPKGVVLIQYNMLVDARGIADWQGITGNQRLMNVLPIHHVNGIIMTLMTPLYVGGSVVVNRQYQSSTFWARMAKERVNVVSVVPTLLQFSCEYAESQKAAGNSIWGEGITREELSQFRHIVCGAGTLAIALVKRFEDQFGFPILHGYGLSETTCYSCHLPIDLVGETGINAALCGHYGVPGLLVTGDEATCREAKELLGDGLTTVAVKRGLTRYSARQIPPVRARQMIEEGAKRALQNLKAVKPYVPAKPITITIELSTVETADQFRGRHGVEIVEPLKVVSRGSDWLQAWNQIWHY